jgi:hypothetical protein
LCNPELCWSYAPLNEFLVGESQFTSPDFFDLGALGVEIFDAELGTRVKL